MGGCAMGDTACPHPHLPPAGEGAKPGLLRQVLAALFLVLACHLAHAQPLCAHLTDARIWPSPSTAWQPPPSLDALDAQDAALLNAATPWQAATLPHARMRARWADRLAIPAADTPEVLWYRLRAPASALALQGTRLYLPRWQTVGTVAVYVNGRLAWQSGERIWNSFNHPVWADLAGLVQPGQDALIHVRMASQPGVGGALSSLWVGPTPELLPRWRWRSFLQTELVGYWRGSFLMLGFVGLAGFGLLKATAHTKFLNFGSNVGAFAVFLVHGAVLWKVGLLMGAGQFLGAQLGSRFAMKQGARIIKPLLVTVSIALAIRLLADPQHPVRVWAASL